MAYLNNIQLRILVEFLDSPARPEGTMSLHELRGFLWGIASSPADVDEEQWLSFVFNGEEPGFRDETEEENIYTLILGLWDEQLTRMEDEETPFPGTDYAWHADPSERWPLTDWCNGFLKGHYWQEEVWNELLDVTEPVETEDGIFDIVQEVDSTLDVAAVFADVEGALEDTEDPAELLASLPELAGQLPWIMMNYAECGSLLGELLDSEEQEPFRREQPKIGRNDPCYCGSGKKYKHCCLHAANDD